jgi:hypothetical protein
VLSRLAPEYPVGYARGVACAGESLAADITGEARFTSTWKPIFSNVITGRGDNERPCCNLNIE